MSPLISEPLAPGITRLVMVGPITLPTLKGDITETVGEQLETIGAGVVAGERRPRPLPLRIPIHGSALDTSRYDAGLRLRRQVRALLENAPARMQGLYLNWAVDPELNGWLLIGGGDLKSANGGITFADFDLELTDCYRVANTRTHRPARRLTRIDRRAATIARDILGTVYSTDFAAVTPITRHFLGVQVTDPVLGSTGAPATTSTRSTRDGLLSYVDGGADGDVIDFEHAEGDLHRAIVRVYDTHGTVVESDWEPVYGPDQPIAGALVLDNAICRALVSAANGQIDVQSWDGAAWVTDATVAHPSAATGFRCRLVEWTSERAVLCITSLLSAGVRGETYVTLQRGWTGPRCELYASTSSTATLNVHAKTSGDATYQRSTGGATAIVSGASIGTFTGLEPWVALVGPGTDRGVAIAVLQEGVNLRGAILSSREGLAFESAASYLSITIGLGARASAATDADELGSVNLIDARTTPELVGR